MKKQLIFLLISLLCMSNSTYSLAPPEADSHITGTINAIPSFKTLTGMLSGFRSDRKAKAFLDQWFIVSLRTLLNGRELPDNIGFIGLSQKQANTIKKRNLTYRDLTRKYILNEISFLRYRDDGMYYSAVDVFKRLIGRDWRSGYIIMFDRDNPDVRRFEMQYATHDERLYTYVNLLHVSNKASLKIPNNAVIIPPVQRHDAATYFDVHEKCDLWVVAMAMRHFLQTVSEQQTNSTSMPERISPGKNTPITVSRGTISDAVSNTLHQLTQAQAIIKGNHVGTIRTMIQKLNEKHGIGNLTFFISEIGSLITHYSKLGNTDEEREIIRLLQRARNNLVIERFLLRNKRFNPDERASAYITKLNNFIEQLPKLDDDDKLPEYFFPDIWQGYRDEPFQIYVTGMDNFIGSSKDRKLRTHITDTDKKTVTFRTYLKTLREMLIIAAYCRFSPDDLEYLQFFGPPATQIDSAILTQNRSWSTLCPDPLSISPHKKHRIKDESFVDSVVSIASVPEKRSVRHLQAYLHRITSVNPDMLTMSEQDSALACIMGENIRLERAKEAQKHWLTTYDIRNGALALINASLARIAVHPDYPGDRQVVLDTIMFHLTHNFEKGSWFKEPVGMKNVIQIILQSDQPEKINMILSLLSKRFPYIYCSFILQKLHEHFRENKNSRDFTRVALTFENFLKNSISASGNFNKNIRSGRGRRSLAHYCAEVFGETIWAGKAENGFQYFSDEYFIVHEKDSTIMALECYKGILEMKEILRRFLILANERNLRKAERSLLRSYWLLTEPSANDLKAVFRDNIFQLPDSLAGQSL